MEPGLPQRHITPTVCQLSQALAYFKGVFGVFTNMVGKPHIQNPADILLDLLSNKDAQEQALRVYEEVLAPLHATTADQLLQGFNVPHAVQVRKDGLHRQLSFSCTCH